MAQHSRVPPVPEWPSEGGRQDEAKKEIRRGILCSVQSHENAGLCPHSRQAPVSHCQGGSVKCRQARAERNARLFRRAQDYEGVMGCHAVSRLRCLFWMGKRKRKKRKRKSHTRGKRNREHVLAPHQRRPAVHAQQDIRCWVHGSLLHRGRRTGAPRRMAHSGRSSASRAQEGPFVAYQTRGPGRPRDDDHRNAHGRVAQDVWGQGSGRGRSARAPQGCPPFRDEGAAHPSRCCARQDVPGP